MNGFSTLTPEAFVRELMHGDKDSFKRGYSPENAVMAVQETRGLDEAEADLLLAHAQGYYDAVCSALQPGYEPLLEDESDWSAVKRGAYERGHTHGLNADFDTIQIA